MALRPGSGEIMTTALDPINNYNVPANWSSHPFDIGGVIKSNNATGANNDGYAVYQGDLSGGVFGKSAGLGDIELGCATPQYLEVGNYVWKDTNKNGVQDPCEPPLSNITVSLWKGGTQIASTTTNASGEYYFSSKSNLTTPANWTATGADTTLLPSMAYEIRIDTTNQAQLDTLKLTTANATTNNGNDQNDSDAAVTGNYAVISFTTGAAGSTNHTLDFGFFPCPTITLPTADTAFCSGTTVNIRADLTNIQTESIKFVYFTSHQTDPSVIYGGTGTTLGTVANASLTDTKTVATLTGATFPANNTGAAITYHVYAILEPNPGAGGCQAFAHRHYTVNPSVTPTFTAVNPICSGATLSALPTTLNNGITGTWSPALDNTTTTTYTFTPTAGQCATTTTLTITVNPLPILTLGSPACQASLSQYDVPFTATGGTATTNQGVISGGNVINVPIANSLTLTVTNGTTGCSVSQTINAPNCSCPTVNAPTKAVGADKTICQGATIPVLAANVGAGETIDWYSAASGGTLLLANSSTYTPTVEGIFYAEARNIASGCLSSTRISVSLTINPLPSVTKPSDQSLCNDASTTAIVLSGSAISGTTYNWANSNTTIGLAASGSGDIGSFAAINNGATPIIATITVTPTANGCDGATQTFTITVNPVPTIANISTDTASCTLGVANSDAAVHVTGIVGMARYAYSTSGTAGLFALTATTSTASSINLTGIANPASPTTYTFRIWGVDTTCYNDTTVVLNPSVCPVCSITATFTQGTCNNNGTSATATDDYFTVTVTGATATNGGASGKYEVVLNGTVLNTGGTAYGTAVTVGTATTFKSDGATTYQLTVRDFDKPACTTTVFTTAPSASCSVVGCKPQICIPVTVSRAN